MSTPVMRRKADGPAMEPIMSGRFILRVSESCSAGLAPWAHEEEDSAAPVDVTRAKSMINCRPGERFVMLTSCWAVSRPAAKNSKDEYALHGFYH